jgi:hypothetical protein
VPFYPFSEGDAQATFGNLRENIIREIRSLENEYVLKASTTELEQHFVSKGKLDPLVVRPQERYVENTSKVEYDTSQGDFRRARIPGRRVMLPGTRVDVSIPFDGSPILWKVRPSSFTVCPLPEIEVGDGRISVSYCFPDASPKADELKQRIERNAGDLAQTAGSQARDVALHNEMLEKAVSDALAEKRAKALSAVNAVAALGMPFKRAAVPPTFTVPVQRRASPTCPPKVPTDSYQPEPALDEKEFSYILGILQSMALVVERNPKSFASLEEEAIRDHFLITLNGHYEGGATGETFNAAGKTDILIRVGDRNVFIAECKFWRGPKSMDDALTQLLAYLTWRDSKCAILVLCKTGNPTAVREKMHAEVIARPEFRKTISDDRVGCSTYTFVKTDDPGRELHLATMLFNIPGGKTVKT